MYSTERKIIKPLNYKYKLFRLKGRGLFALFEPDGWRFLGEKYIQKKKKNNLFIPICRTPGTYLNQHDSARKNHKFLLHATKEEAKLVKVTGEPLDLYF